MTPVFRPLLLAVLLPLACASEPEFRSPLPSPILAERLVDGPIIGPETHPSLGSNIQGPSLIRVPEWVPDPLGRYYLYFADHKGRYIRLAYADTLTGPWTVHPPGSLQLADSGFPSSFPAPPFWRVIRFRLTIFFSGVEPPPIPSPS